jgi:uncharacterized paraquat-inducible protein A
MSDATIITTPNGKQWLPSSSRDTVHCATCDNEVDTPEEIASYPDGNCPQCANPWTGCERKSTAITVTAPEAVGGQVF